MVDNLYRQRDERSVPSNGQLNWNWSNRNASRILHNSMRRLLLIIGFLLCSIPAQATTYYLANAATTPVGNDSNSGLDAAHPWLTPNHAVNCGDQILAIASASYLGSQFGIWGTVTCAGGNNVAWLICAVFDSCKVTSSSANSGFFLDKSYWGISGWEITSTVDGAFCFEAFPLTMAQGTHHVIFANNVANGCFLAGFGAGQSGTVGVDYLVIIGNIAYNAAQDIGGCVSGIDIFEPVNFDTLPGTHIYIAGNFSYSNVNPNPCGGGVPTDGEGIILDTLSGTNDGLPYTGQIVVDNNILLSNGGRGFQVFLNNAATPTARVYARYNTLWGNNTQTSDPNTLCGEMLINFSATVEEYWNLAATSATNGCSGGSNPLYAYSVGNSNGTDHVYSNTAWVASGTYTQSVSNGGFSFGPNNITSTTLSFANAVTPGAPSCGSSSSVPNCMATVIANFAPTTAAAIPYGYQPVSTTSRYDPLFPQWLCAVTNLPAGLVTMGCLAGSGENEVTISGVTVH